MRWTEDTSKVLCFVVGAMVAGCVFIIAARLLDAFAVARVPSLPSPWGGIFLWVLFSLSILFAMDRNFSSEGEWGSRLRLLRRVLFLAVFAAIGVVIYVG